MQARGFRSGERIEDNKENADETHSVIDIDNGQTLGFSGDEVVIYAEAVSGGGGMTMVAKIIGGRDAPIQPPFVIFKN